MTAATNAITTPGAMLGSVLDAVTSAAAGRRVRVRVRLSVGGILAGHADRATIHVEHVQVAGLDVASARVEARRVWLQPGWTPRLRAASATLRARVTQTALDRWLLASALPVRLRLCRDGLSVRTGAAGLRVAEVDAALELDGSRIVIVPSRARLLGIDVPTAALRLALPLPPLPAGTRIVAVDVADGELAVTLQAEDVDEPLTAAHAARVQHALRPIGRPKTARPQRSIMEARR